MTEPAGLHLLAQQGRGEIALRLAGLGVAPPEDTLALVKASEEPLRRIVFFPERPPALLLTGPGHMPGGLPMTGLTADVDLRETRGKAIARGVIVLAHARRVALRAHEIPVLAESGPMQGVVVLDLLVGIEVKPALAALAFRPAVPRNRQRLHAPVWKLDQILLQRIDAERVFDFECGEPAVRPIGLDVKSCIFPEEARPNPVIIEARIIEIAQHGFLRGMLHGKGVLGRAPQLRLRLMTSGAALAADEAWD